MSCFTKSLETNVLGFFCLVCFSSSLQLMLTLSINSLLRVIYLLLGFLTVILGALIFVDLIRQAPSSSNTSACPKTYLKPPSWVHHGKQQMGETLNSLIPPGPFLPVQLYHHTCAMNSTVAKVAFRKL